MKNFFTFLILSSTFFSSMAEAVGIEILGTYYQLDTIDGKFPRTCKLEVYDSQGNRMSSDGKSSHGQVTFEKYDSQGNRTSPTILPYGFEKNISELPTYNKPVKVKFTDNQTIPDNSLVKFILTFGAVKFSELAVSPVLYVTPDIEAVNLAVYPQYRLALKIKKRGAEEWITKE